MIAGEYFLQKNRQRPTVRHDVVERQHKAVLAFGYADQYDPEGRRSEVAGRGTLGSGHQLNLLFGF